MLRYRKKESILLGDEKARRLRIKKEEVSRNRFILSRNKQFSSHFDTVEYERFVKENFEKVIKSHGMLKAN